ncbi:MAG: hypothetical protein R3192_12245 [Woeseiaceae bacterium]|nr:hypothetical protein [Woeseiaceae bacterium]
MQASIQEVKARHEAELMAKPGVVSVGIGLDDDGSKVIVVGVEREQPEILAQVPRSVDGYQVRVDVVGKMKAE